MFSRGLLLNTIGSQKRFHNGSLRLKKLYCTAKLSGIERESALNDFSKSGWVHLSERDAIAKKFKFDNFVDCFSFMTQVALVAEAINHHPEWFNVYNTVDIVLSTHDCGGLSSLDVKLASKIDEFASQRRHRDTLS